MLKTKCFIKYLVTLNFLYIVTAYHKNTILKFISKDSTKTTKINDRKMSNNTALKTDGLGSGLSVEQFLN